MIIPIVRRYFISGLYVFIGLLLIANLFLAYNEMVVANHYFFARYLYFDRRLNLPFFFSVSLLLINLFLLYRIAFRSTLSKSQSIFWATLFAIFLLFTLDEIFYIHQHFKMSTFGTIASYDRASWSHYLWVIPYFVVFGILFGILFKYSDELTQTFKMNLMVTGFIFLLGAVVMEFVGTYYSVIRPYADVYILLIKSAEGVLQLVGSVMFIDTFLQWPKNK